MMVTDDGRHDLLHAAVEGLPGTQQDVINALYWEQLSQGMLARRLGISQQAVSRRHTRALHKIARLLDGNQP
jgi:RNA polymerase sigma factor (sigma-70 family)